MSRGMTWAATTVPEIRRHWCNALDATVENHSTGLEAKDVDPALIKKLQRMQEKLTGAIDTMAAEADALRTAELYWVTRDMVDMTIDAAATLPECYVTVPRLRQLLSVVSSVGSG